MLCLAFGAVTSDAPAERGGDAHPQHGEVAGVHDGLWLISMRCGWVGEWVDGGLDKQRRSMCIRHVARWDDQSNNKDDEAKANQSVNSIQFNPIDQPINSIQSINQPTDR
jgi:uncharacterized protein YeaC (DUF1315 family)